MATTSQSSPVRPYRDFLTPVLHRRFVHAAAISLAASYVVSTFQGFSFSELPWCLLPLPGVAIRTSCVFIAVFMTFILHVAQLHVGRRRAASQAYEVLSRAYSAQAPAMIAWYIFSAFIFCEAYMWSRSKVDNLAMVDPGKPYERPKLNERPIFLRTLFMIVGSAQGIRHIVQDKTRIAMPIRKSQSAIQSPLKLLQAQLPNLLGAAAGYTAVLLLIAPILYLLVLRHSAWQLGSVLAKSIYTLPKFSRPPSFVTFFGDLLGRFACETCLLISLWDIGSVAFDANIAQAPLKNNLPLTADSKDPNGSLLQGLRVKKEFTRSSAFWELNIIAREVPTRRETIYRELDRAGGSAWSQLVTVCLGELHAVSKRIQDSYVSPMATQAPTLQAQQAQMDPLPKLAPPLKEGQLLANPPPASGNGYVSKYVAPTVAAAGSFAKSHGQYHATPNPASRAGQKLLNEGNSALHTLEEKTQTTPSGLLATFWLYVHQVLATRVGEPFRQTFGRRAAAVVIGDAEKGGSNASIIADATLSLARLAVCSLKEDRFGRVSRDVPSIIRTYTMTIRTIENFVRTLDVHWTDVAFDARRRSEVFGSEGAERARWEEGGFQGDMEVGRCVEEVGEVLLALRQALSELLSEFGEFRDELGLSLGEMRTAKEAVGAAGETARTNGAAVR